ncbi:hypothetical protein A0H81_02833 [Grifola frondosa]|uniref:Uncharacterized protein n=1 Tax=Grifola frondosa TaxID=5627 RepID=A0A1C7MN25_GRIFR|nr:hypothetical protein A0H81_02833 [Grifola frondosa]
MLDTRRISEKATRASFLNICTLPLRSSDMNPSEVNLGGGPIFPFDRAAVRSIWHSIAVAGTFVNENQPPLAEGSGAANPFILGSPGVTGRLFGIRSGRAEELNPFTLRSPHLHGTGAPEEPGPVHVGSPPPLHTVDGAEQCNGPDHQLSDDIHMEELHGLQAQLNVGKATPILNEFFWVLPSGSHLMIQWEPSMVESYVL